MNKEQLEVLREKTTRGTVLLSDIEVLKHEIDAIKGSPYIQLYYQQATYEKPVRINSIDNSEARVKLGNLILQILNDKLALAEDEFEKL